MSEDTQDTETTASVAASQHADTVLRLFSSLQQLGVTPRSIRVGEVEVQVASVQKSPSDEAVTAAHPREPSSYLARAMDRRERSMR
jgi:hypothetical protein